MSIYSIKILQSTIDTHATAIAKLEKADAESMGDMFFIEDEIKERRDSIKELKEAVSILNKTAVPLVKIMEGKKNG